MSVKVIYRDVDFQAKENLGSIEVHGNVQEQAMDKDILRYVGIANQRTATVEENFWRLDGSYDVVDDVAGFDVGVFGGMSETGKGENGYSLSEPVRLDYIFSAPTTIKNITFTFDDPDYCTYARIYVYEDMEKTKEIYAGELIGDSPFPTIDLGNVFLASAVSFEFLAVNKPKRFLKVYGVDFGIAQEIPKEYIYNVSILRETSLIGDSIPVGTTTVDINTKFNPKLEFKKYKPIFVYRDGRTERVAYVNDVYSAGMEQKTLSCVDPTHFLNVLPDVIINYFTPQEYYSKEIDNYIATQYSKYEMNYANYVAPSYEVEFTKVVEAIENNAKLKIDMDDDIAIEKVFSRYEPVNIKAVLINMTFSLDLKLVVKNNGCCLLTKSPKTNVMQIASDRIFANYSITTHEKINQINIASWEINSTDKTQRLGDSDGSISVSSDALLVFDSAYFDPATNITESRYFYQDTPHTAYIDLRWGQNYTEALIFNYKEITFVQKSKQIFLEEINANTFINAVNVATDNYILYDDLQNIEEKLIDYYKHNVEIEFDAVLDHEAEGDNIMIELAGKIYIGRIKTIEYTMQGKKIGTIKMKVYDEENVNG